MKKILSGILLLPIVLILVGIAYCEINKAYWDYKVKQWCEKDGGVTVFEKVEISKVDYPDLKLTSGGIVILPIEKRAVSDEPYFLRYKFTNMHNGFLSVERSSKSIVRNADKKILSEQVSYKRSGGDFPTGLLYPSHYNCDTWQKDTGIFISTITIKG